MKSVGYWKLKQMKAQRLKDLNTCQPYTQFQHWSQFCNHTYACVYMCVHARRRTLEINTSLDGKIACHLHIGVLKTPYNEHVFFYFLNVILKKSKEPLDSPSPKGSQKEKFCKILYFFHTVNVSSPACCVMNTEALWHPELVLVLTTQLEEKRPKGSSHPPA